MGFQEKVLSLKGSEILLTMINGLKKPATEIEMHSYGHFDSETFVCYGCAATNVIANIVGIKKVEPEMFESNGYTVWSTKVFSDYNERKFISIFESAIDHLRLGKIFVYNEYAKIIGISTLPNTKSPLPILSTNNYLKNLPAYEEYLEQVIEWENSQGEQNDNNQ